MQEQEAYNLITLKQILEQAHQKTQSESKFDPTLLAISILLEEGVRPETLITVFGSMGYSYGQPFVFEGSKYKYKQIRNRYPLYEQAILDIIAHATKASLN